MPAYMIVTAKIHDRDRFIQDYGAHAAKLVAEYGGKYILMQPNAQLLEGHFADGGSMVISEWPDKETCLRFWNSPEYAEIKKAREGISEVEVMLIEAPSITG